MKITHAICLFSTLLFIRCQTKSSGDQTINSRTDTFSVNIPKNVYGKNIYFSYDSMLARKLNLDDLTKGYDSIQVRIWMNYGLLIRQNVLVIKNNSAEWSAELVTMNVRGDSILEKHISKIIPKSGWKQLTKKLIDFNSLSIQDMSLIPGIKSGGGDLPVYSFEVCTKSFYRFYSYDDPKLIKKKNADIKNVDAILTLLDEEFDLDRPTLK